MLNKLNSERIMKRELIKTIRIDNANLEHIAKTGIINGTLLTEIEIVMTEFAQKQANGVEQSYSNCNIPLVSNLVCQHQKRQFIPELNKDLCLNCGELI